MIGAREAPTREELVQRLPQIGGEYRFLSRLLAAPPGADLLADAHATGLLGDGWESRIEHVQVEYTRLFSYPGPDAIPVNQSVYTDTLQIEPSVPGSSGCGMGFPGGRFHGYLGGESCAELARWYSAAGYEGFADARHMPDHVSVELDFLAHLHLAEARALSIDAPEEALAFRELASAFRQGFLDRWLEKFCRSVSLNTVSELYRGVAARLLALSALSNEPQEASPS